MKATKAHDEFRLWWSKRHDAGHRHKTEEWFERNAHELLSLFPHGGTLVDVGCGNAQLLSYLAPHYDEVIGVDFVPSMLEAAKERLDGFGLKNVRLELGDACALPRSISRANVIMSNQVVQNLYPEQISRHLAECRRILATDGVVGMCGIPWVNLRKEFASGKLREPWPGRGRLLLQSLDPRRWKFALQRAWHEGAMADGIGLWYSRTQIMELAKEAGFDSHIVCSWYYECRFHAVLRLAAESEERQGCEDGARASQANYFSRQTDSGHRSSSVWRGVKHTLAQALDTIPRIRMLSAYEMRKDDAWTMPAGPAGIRIETVTSDNVADIEPYRGKGVEAEFRRYLAAGHVGLYAYSGNVAVGHAWAAVSPKGRILVNGYMPVTRNIACIHFCAVNPDYRGRKIYQGMLAELLNRCRAMPDIRQVDVYTDVDNAASRAAVERVGFHWRGTRLVLLWRGWRLRLFKIGHRKDLPKESRSV